MINPRQMLVSRDKYNKKCPYRMHNVEWIVVHNTYNDASAVNEIKFMINNDNEVSYHFAVDDKEVVQGIPLNRNTWNAGDGQGPGNRKGISIEICYSKSGGDRFEKAEKLAAKFIAQLLQERGWGIDRVRTHQSFAKNKKYCPHRTLDMGWQRFLKMIEEEMGVSNTIRVKIGSEVREIPGTLENGTNYILYKGKKLALRDILEFLGFTVSWDNVNKIVG